MTYIPAHKLVSFAKITIDATASLYTNMAAAIFIFLSILKARSRYKAKTIVFPVRCWSGNNSMVAAFLSTKGVACKTNYHLVIYDAQYTA